MRLHDDPARPDDRRRELVRILAAGLLRLPLPALSIDDPDMKNLPESSQDRLELTRPTVLSVTTG